MEKYCINFKEVSSESFENEAVVVNFMTGKYFGMTGSGPKIWAIFETPASQQDVITRLRENYPDISEEQVKEATSFIDALLQEKLLVVAETGCNGTPVKNLFDGAEGDFQLPKLEIYEDLQELIILDPIHDADPERGWPTQQGMIKQK